MKNIDIICENKILRIINNIRQVCDKITKEEETYAHTYKRTSITYFMILRV